MVEVAKQASKNNKLTDKDVNDLKERILEFRKVRSKNWKSDEWWKENKVNYWNKIVDVILENKRENVKTEEERITYWKKVIENNKN